MSQYPRNDPYYGQNRGISPPRNRNEAPRRGYFPNDYRSVSPMQERRRPSGPHMMEQERRRPSGPRMKEEEVRRPSGPRMSANWVDGGFSEMYNPWLRREEEGRRPSEPRMSANWIDGGFSEMYNPWLRR
jgi:hypothetical protein